MIVDKEIYIFGNNGDSVQMLVHSAGKRRTSE